MNKRGQALVEFVIILPIFLLLIFTAIDFGKILYSKISLENTTNDVIKLYKEGKSYVTIENYLKKNDRDATFKIKNNNNKYLTFTINSKVNITTPGLSLVLDNPYNVEVKRTIYYDE